MSMRLAAAALALSLAAPATAALAQGAAHPAAAGQSVYLLLDDDIDVTGAIDPRTPDLSAEAGNAARPELADPNLGDTSGGPAY